MRDKAGPVIEWVCRDLLARSPGPGYLGKSATTRKEGVEAWLAEAKSLGIRSIICLLNEELEWYRDIGLHEEGLLGFYRQCGLEVSHVPVTDGRRPPVPSDDLDRAVETFDALPSPVLVHCKAGVDRTGAVIDHILRKRLCR